MAKRTEETNDFGDGEIVYSEPVFNGSYEETPVLTQEDVDGLLEDAKSEESKFVKLARLYSIGQYGFVALNLENKEKRVVPKDNVYYEGADKRFSMTLDEFNSLKKLTDLK